MRRVVMLGALLTTTCAAPRSKNNPYNEVVGQYNSIMWAWHDFYEMSDRPPSVTFIQGEGLSCWFNKGFMADAFNQRTGLPDRMCLEGRYSPATNTIMVAWPQEQTFSGSSLCHELWHAVSFKKTGDPDAYHVSKGFVFGGTVDRCVAFLREMNL